MRVVILGSGCPRPDLARRQPAVLVDAGGEPILVDCGAGTGRQLLRCGVDLASVRLLLVTHMHADHTLGYGELMLDGWIAGRNEMAVCGPPGLQRLHDALFHEIYCEDIRYRQSLGRPPAGLTEAVHVCEMEGEGMVHVSKAFTIRRLPVTHTIPTFAYRIDVSGDGSIVISGDTIYHEPLAAFARGADILVHDACFTPPSALEPDTPTGRFWQGIHSSHASPLDAARIAASAGVKTLVLTHLMPFESDERIMHECRKAFQGQTIIAEDLLAVHRSGCASALPHPGRASERDGSHR